VIVATTAVALEGNAVNVALAEQMDALATQITFVVVVETVISCGTQVVALFVRLQICTTRLLALRIMKKEFRGT